MPQPPPRTDLGNPFSHGRKSDDRPHLPLRMRSGSRKRLPSANGIGSCLPLRLVLFLFAVERSWLGPAPPVLGWIGDGHGEASRCGTPCAWRVSTRSFSANGEGVGGVASQTGWMLHAEGSNWRGLDMLRLRGGVSESRKSTPASLPVAGPASRGLETRNRVGTKLRRGVRGIQPVGTSVPGQRGNSTRKAAAKSKNAGQAQKSGARCRHAEGCIREASFGERGERGIGARLFCARHREPYHVDNKHKTCTAPGSFPPASHRVHQHGWACCA